MTSDPFSMRGVIFFCCGYMPKINLSEIKIGIRHRKDMGDLQSLADSMEEIGLLHPIVINKQNKLIAGHRRIESAKMLGWKDISATVIDLDKIVLGERAENVIRKDLTPSEAVAIKTAVEPMEKELANSRMAVRGGKFPQVKESEKGKARDKVAYAVGMSARTLDKATMILREAVSTATIIQL